VKKGGREAYRITESQSHRMVGIGSDLCGSSGPPEIFGLATRELDFPQL